MAPLHVVSFWFAGSQQEKEYSLAWWRRHAHVPVYPGSEYTVFEISWIQLSKKLSSRQSDVDFEANQAFMRELLQPVYKGTPNLWPTSAYVMKGIVCPDAKQLDWSSFEYHCCDNPKCTGHVYDHISRSDWQDHADDVCPHCQSERFVKSGEHPSTWRPTAWFIYFGLESVIKNQFWANPEWTKTLPKQGESRAAYFSSPEFQRLAAALGNWLLDPQQCAIYELGIDWIQPFNHCTHSTGVVVIRCKEQPDNLVARSVNCAVLMLLPGPREHRNMNSVFKLVAEDMARLQDSGMQVWPAVRVW